MVNITHKNTTLRKAIAVGYLKVTQQSTIDAIQNRTVAKGDVFEFSRAAGLLACKKTYEVVPDCHPLPIEFTSIKHEIEGLSIKIIVEIHTVYKTGVEVEAMHGVMITALTMYDMLKPIDGKIEISSIELIEKKGGKSDIKSRNYEHLKAAIITCSDTLSKNAGMDKSGDLLEEIIASKGIKTSFRQTIADDIAEIQALAQTLIAQNYDLILLTGGTGLSKRDVTPEAIRPMFTREIPSIMEAARNYGQQRTQYAMLSRGVAGFAQNTLIITLPGSTKGVEESMHAIFPYFLHVFDVKDGERHG